MTDNTTPGITRLRMWTRAFLGVFLMAGVVFISAGRADYWQGWLFSGYYCLFTVIVLH